LVFAAGASGRGAAVGSGLLWFCVILVSSHKVLFRAVSICAFCVCWSANLVSISVNRSLVSSGGRSTFSEAGEGNSSGVTTISLDDEAENARSRKREILAVRRWDFRSRLFYPIML
jgi:hypothetical protein